MKIANFIDHTVLKADAAAEDIKKLCKEAMDYHFYAVCVNPIWVKTAKKLLKNSNVKVCTVVGFPLGAAASETKAFEAKQAVADGVDEIDMVMNIGALKSGHLECVQQDIESVVAAAGRSARVKVIIETCLLTKKEKEIACQLIEKSGADFVKTSTGFASGGATVDDIKLLKSIVEDRVEIKASGGIRDYAFAAELIEAGATRIGSSASVAIVNGGSME